MLMRTIRLSYIVGRDVQAWKQPGEPDRQDADRYQHHPDGLAERLPVAPASATVSA
jgi:hypothetical protein